MVYVDGMSTHSAATTTIFRGTVVEQFQATTLFYFGRYRFFVRSQVDRFIRTVDFVC